MDEMTQAIAPGILSFVATNLDDIVILLIFFGQISPSFRVWHIVLGQYLGFTVLVLLSLPGFFGGLLIPQPWIGLLGFLPIAIGIFKLLHPENEVEVQAVLPCTPHAPHALKRRSPWSCLTSLLASPVYGVAAITFANGGDNIGIYMPLFAGSSFSDLMVILSIFFGMVGIWCYAAWRLVRQPAIARLLTRYGDRAVPFVLIGLGIFILIENGSSRLLPS